MMDARVLQLLEFHKVLRHISSFAVSEAGRDACLLLLPEKDPARIAERSGLIRELLSFSDHAELKLSFFPDVTGVFAFLSNPSAVLDQDGLIGIWAMLKIAAALKAGFGEPDPETYPLAKSLAEALVLPARTWSALGRCLTPDGDIRDEASPELFSARREIRRLHQMCTRKVRDFFQNKDLSDILQDDYLTISSDRYVLALKNNFKGRLKGIVHDYSQTGETCYFEPYFLVDLNNSLQELRREERAEEQEVLRFLTDLVRSEQKVLEDTFAGLVRCDVLLAVCCFARSVDARNIEVVASGRLRLMQARHPLLVIGQDHVVPVDIELKDDQRVLIITGGNAGGKTVCLKTLGLLALMAHTGLPVTAAQDSELPFWDNYVVSMGDEQSIEHSLSTFTAQIRNFSEVWPSINSGTLVILDEFGVGTDPSQGAALAQAVVDGLMEKGAWIGAATHFPALKAYGLSREGVRAASVIFSPDTKKPLFKLGYDQVGASRALDVAREQGLPESVLNKAQEYLYPDAGGSEEIFDRLNRLAADKEAELAEIKAKARVAEEKTARKLEKLEQERVRMQTELRAASQEIMRAWRAGQTGRKESVRRLAELRESVKASMSDARAETPLSFQDIAPDQILFYVPWGKNGRVCEVNARRERIRLDIGGVNLWVELRDVRPGEERQKPTGSAVVRNMASAAPSLSLDLRGARTDEAEAELARFLDKALLAGRAEVEIIHGMGTGAVRRAVHEHLRHSRVVESFRLADADEGGDGMTKVVLTG